MSHNWLFIVVEIRLVRFVVLLESCQFPEKEGALTKYIT